MEKGYGILYPKYLFEDYASLSRGHGYRHDLADFDNLSQSKRT